MSDTATATTTDASASTQAAPGTQQTQQSAATADTTQASTTTESTPSLKSWETPFEQGWRDNDTLKPFGTLSKFDGKTPADLAKAYANLEQLKGGPGAAQVPAGMPPESPEVALFRTQNNIPNDPAAYVFKPDVIPEGMSWDDNRGSAMAKAMHAANLTPTQAKALSEAFTGYETQAFAEVVRRNQEELKNEQFKLQQEWGPSYDQNIQNIRRLVLSQGGDPEDPEIFRNPKVVKAIHSAVKLINPDSIAGMRGSSPTGQARFANGRDEAKDIKSNPNNPLHKAYWDNEPHAVQTVQRLYAQG